MKKRITTLFFVSTIVLAACIFLEMGQAGNRERDAVNVQTEIGKAETKENDNIEESKAESETEAESVPDKEFSFTEEEMFALQKEQEGLYTFDCLDEQEQAVYAEIYASLIYMRETELSTTDADCMEKVFQCVLNDHPEIFYVDGYTFTKYTRGNNVTKILFEAAYTMDKAEIE
ncbi:MAG: hypothetical protein K2K54_05855 [Lachnospiraceae bacterium]|nr:hypothetical protein [Lachnospiraceae bacterium]